MPSTRMIVGASRGLGRVIARDLRSGGAEVITVSRSSPTPSDQDAGIVDVRADATDPASARRLLGEHRPNLLVLNAGAVPTMGHLDELSWSEFESAWRTDVRLAFEWVSESLRHPLHPGSHVVLMASGAALDGSPLSGGYSGAKATVGMMARQAALGAGRLGIDTGYSALYPKLNPHGGVGQVGIAAYAAAAGVDTGTFVEQLRPVPSGESISDVILRISDGRLAPGRYLLDGEEARPL